MEVTKATYNVEKSEELTHHFEEIKELIVKDLFLSNKERWSSLSFEFNGSLFDFSKNRITSETIDIFTTEANTIGLNAKIDALFTGEKINSTENRTVLHTALRNPSDEGLKVDGQEIYPLIQNELQKIESFCATIHSGAKTGSTGRKIKSIVNIGIGGSHLGPAMVVEALKDFQIKGISTFYVSNIDASDLQQVLAKVDAETCLFVVVSKTFTTLETMTNARTAKKWLVDKLGESAVSKHFVGITASPEKLPEFGILEDYSFSLWDWVGGRYSLWSSVGLSIALSIGFDNFKKLQKGAYLMDCHFRSTTLEKNIPFIQAVIGIWYNNFFNSESYAILPYNQRLNKFVPFIQQCDMESNGKQCDRQGEKVTTQTGPIVWGEPGTNGQHAFYQLLHQGTKFIPIDFIAFSSVRNGNAIHQDKLISNFIAQSEALMTGKSKERVLESLPKKADASLVNHKVFEGNRPSSSFFLPKLDPENLGQLIALYEHKIFVQGVFWGINSFDQWGVELGKELATKILQDLRAPNPATRHDDSSNGLINFYLKSKD